MWNISISSSRTPEWVLASSQRELLFQRWWKKFHVLPCNFAFSTVILFESVMPRTSLRLGGRILFSFVNVCISSSWTNVRDVVGARSISVE